MMTSEQIRSAGMQALQQRLGRAGMVRFLQLFSAGTGDYTKSRREWVDNQSLDELVGAIHSQHSARKSKRRA